jgi:hypothetical protein
MAPPKKITVKRASQDKPGATSKAHGVPDELAAARLRFALASLASRGRLAGARTKRMSARVDPGLVEAAREKTGLDNDSDLINAALAVIAAPDDFGPWFAAQAGRLPKDFELEI